jgi:hypothetical protein
VLELLVGNPRLRNDGVNATAAYEGVCDDEVCVAD